jgi:hypothetical protein
MRNVALAIAACGLSAIAATAPARADETACLYAGQDYSLGAVICAGSRVAIECHAPDKGGKDAYWTKEHSEDCQAAPKTQ